MHICLYGRSFLVLRIDNSARGLSMDGLFTKDILSLIFKHFVLCGKRVQCSISCTELHYLRIDKRSPGGALYLCTCIHNYGNCNGMLCIE